MSEHGSLLDRLAPLVMGGAGFSYQLHSSPDLSNVIKTIRRALDLGVQAFDTSPYYEPSEQLMGSAFQHPDITSQYRREDYVLMTKVGRIAVNHFDYSPEWIRASVQRSLQRFGTGYLDVVFCHDIEYVPKKAAIRAVGVLFELARTGMIKAVGISGYNIAVLADIAQEVRSIYGRPLDVVQNWGQLTLQNTQLERRGLVPFKDAGVKAVCCASPLAVGLLRLGGVPIGSLGNWHPAPEELRRAAQQAAQHVADRGDKLSSLALRFSISRAFVNSDPEFVVTTITGISSIKELEENVQSLRRVLKAEPESSSSHPPGSILRTLKQLDGVAVSRDEVLCKEVKTIMGQWLDYDLEKPVKVDYLCSTDTAMTSSRL